MRVTKKVRAKRVKFSLRAERSNPRSVASPESFRDVAITFRSLAALGTTPRVGLPRPPPPVKTGVGVLAMTTLILIISHLLR